MGQTRDRQAPPPELLPHQSSFQRILTGTAFFLFTLIAAVTGYILAGWQPLDAIYMVVITIFGVGYGEVKPLDSPALKIFTILVIIAGTSSAVYMVGGFVQMITEGEINRAFSSKRMTRDIETLNQHAIVCGFGRIGQVLAQQLASHQQAFVILDQSPERVARAEALGYLVRQGNAADEATLASVGIDRASVLATVLPDDATNVFITLTARELNPSLTIVARGELSTTEKKLRLAGANHVVLPANLSALQMANLITRPTASDFLEQGEGRRFLNDLLLELDVQLDELAVPADSPLVGKTIRELEVRGKGTFILVALRRSDGTTLIHPDPTVILTAADTLIVMGHRGDIPKFARNYELNHQLRYRGSKV